MSTSTKSFWSSIPGMATAVAGILTGVVGLGTLGVQLGVVGDKDKSSNQATQSTPEDGGAGAAGSVGGTGSTAAKVSFAVNPGTLSVKALAVAAPPATVIVTNQGDVAMAVKTPQVSGTDADRFEVDADSCITSRVPVEGSCTITVTLIGGVEEANATMTISVDGASESEKVTLKGTLAG